MGAAAGDPDDADEDDESKLPLKLWNGDAAVASDPMSTNPRPLLTFMLLLVDVGSEAGKGGPTEPETDDMVDESVSLNDKCFSRRTSLTLSFRMRNRISGREITFDDL